MGNDDFNPDTAPYDFAFKLLDEAIEAIKNLSNDDRFRCRPLSIAITNLETGEMWMARAFGEWLDSARDEYDQEPTPELDEPR